MGEMAFRGHLEIACSADARHVIPERINTWLERVARLGSDDLGRLLPLLDAEDDVDAMRRLIRMCIVLAYPERALENWLERPHDELLRHVFQLRMVAAYLIAHERGQPPVVQTLEPWCKQVLVIAIQADDNAMQRIARGGAAARQDEVARRPPSAAAEAHRKRSASGEAVPEEIIGDATSEEMTDVETSRIERSPGAEASSSALPGHGADTGTLH